MLLRRVRQPRGLQRLRDEIRIGAAAEVLALERVGDPEGLIERARHGAQSGPAAQEQSPINIKENQRGFQFCLLPSAFCLNRIFS
jgi:hypothetical protein